MTIFIFDLDGTITAMETLPVIGRHFNLEEKISRLTLHAVRGDVPYTENFIERVRLLGKLPVAEIAGLLESIEIHAGLLGFIERHREHCAIATTNLDIWISGLVSRIPCRAYSSHALEGLPESGLRLEKILKKEELVQEFRAQGHTVVFTGDGHNDMEAMRLADVSIACGITHEPAKSLRLVADYLCYDEDALCHLLELLS